MASRRKPGVWRVWFKVIFKDGDVRDFNYKIEAWQRNQAWKLAKKGWEGHCEVERVALLGIERA